MKISKIMNYINSIAPLDKKIQGDNIGLLVKGKENIRRVVVCLDMSKDAIEFASFSKADLVITHHPVIYEPMYKIDNDELIIAIRNRIGVISLHTNYDSARLNDILADKCFIKDTRKIFFEDQISLGRIGITEETDFYNYIKKIKKSLNLDWIKITGNIPGKIRTVAVGTGSSGSFADSIKELDADIFITGEIKYDVIKSIAYKGPTIIELGHYESEECFIDDLAGLMKTKFPSIDIFTYKKKISSFI
ncbi:MAG: Nif3-like dinuclear metal center hexameric protein [Clostridia bacterium]|jgi:dinuclear metal center YbgI/SA1388 family protein